MEVIYRLLIIANVCALAFVLTVSFDYISDTLGIDRIDNFLADAEIYPLAISDTSVAPAQSGLPSQVSSQSDEVVLSMMSDLVSVIGYLVANQSTKQTLHTSSGGGAVDYDLFRRQINSLMDDSSDDRQTLSDSITNSGELDDTTLLSPTLIDATVTSLSVSGTTTFGAPLTLLSSSPSDTAAKLYNTAGSLYWAGSLIAGGTVGTWDGIGTDVYRLTGNVGIGTTTPTQRLTVAGSGLFDGNLSALGGTMTAGTASEVGNLFLGGNPAAGNGYRLHFSGTDAYNDFDGSLYFRNGAASAVHMAINSDSSVLFNGDALFNGSAQVVGSVATSSSNGLTLKLGRINGIPNNSTDSFVGVGDTGSLAALAGDILLIPRSSIGVANAIRMFTGQGTPIERFTITSSGNVGIGTTSPQKKLHVSGGQALVGTGQGDWGFNYGLQVKNAVGEYSSLSVWQEGIAVGQIGFLPNDPTLLISNGAIAGGDFDLARSIALTTSGNVGIGMTTPQQKLDVYGNIMISETGGKLMFSDGGGVWSAPQIWRTASNTIALSDYDGVEFGGFDGSSYGARMVVQGTGNVGIGTTTPASKLDVWGDFRVGTGTTPALYVNPATGNVGIGTTTPSSRLGVYGSTATTLNLTRQNTAAIKGNLGSAIDFGIDQGSTGASNNSALLAKIVSAPMDGWGGQIAFYTKMNDAIATTTPVERMRINHLGNVGIGTTSPNGALTVYRASQAYSTEGTGALTIANANGRYVELGYDNNVDAGFIRAYQSGVTNKNLVLNAEGGKVGIGTTTPTGLLTVAGTINSSALLGGATNLTTDANGNIIRDPSDERLKENITDIEGALATVLDLRGVRYEWRDEARFGEQTEIGFIAQEVDLILPEVVSKGGDYWSLNTKNMVAVVVEAIKELWDVVSENVAQDAEQEAEIELLRARIEALEAEQGNFLPSQEPVDDGNSTNSSSSDPSDTDNSEDVEAPELPELPAEPEDTDSTDSDAPLTDAV
jgi:hypothetical protein